MKGVIMCVLICTFYPAQHNGQTTSDENQGYINPADSESDLQYTSKNCTRATTKSVTMTVLYQDTCTHNVETCRRWWPFRKCRTKQVKRPCSKYKVQTTTQPTVEAVCCPGYIPFNDSIACVKGCEVGKYGGNCSLDCNCSSNAREDCERPTGKCICKDGWTGQNCTDVCAVGYFGHKCESECPCVNNGTCNHVTGECNCTEPGWTGDTCDTECAEGWFGYRCNQTCSCTTNQTCDPHTGDCICNAGVTGVNCTEVCSPGYFGVECRQRCLCRQNNTAMCDPVNGSCTCKPGRTGQECNEVCDTGSFGNMCGQRCNCSSKEFCHPINGECLSRCLCSVNGTQNCDPSLGECSCQDVQRNTTPTALDEYLDRRITNPKDICDSGEVDAEFCIPTNATVTCECRRGWTGYSCEKKCDKGYYGENCESTCDCNKATTVTCNPESGQCECGPGWQGVHCQVAADMVADQLNVGLVVGTTLPGVVIIGLAILCIVFYTRKGGQQFRKTSIVFGKKKRRPSERSIDNHLTYELQGQPDIIESTAQRQSHATGRHDDMEKQDGDASDVYSQASGYNETNCKNNGFVVDGVYNELDNHKTRHTGTDSEYSHTRASNVTSDPYDVIQRSRVEREVCDDMYDSARQMTHMYDSFGGSGQGAGASADSEYDTNESVMRDCHTYSYPRKT